MQTKIGKVSNVSGRMWFLTTEDGEELRIHFEGEGRPPIETKIALVISDEPEYEDGGYSCVPEGKYWSYVDGPAGYPNETNKRIALYWQHWPGRDEAQEMKDATRWAEELRVFYSMYARKKWNVEVRPFITHSSTRAEPPSYGIQDILHGDKPVDLGDFEPVYHHVSSIYSNSSYCGLGNLSGNVGATYRYGNTCNEHTFIHELGHNFGLHHANDHYDGEYEDPSCVMGKSRAAPGLNSPHLLELKLESDRERIDLNHSSQLLICPIEVPEYAMHDGEWQHVVLERDGHDRLYVSMRKKKGWPWNPGKYSEDTLYVHYRKDGKTWLHSTHRPNPTTPSRLMNGVKMTYHEYANETARVSFDYNDGIVPMDIEMPSGFPEVFAGAELTKAHAGLWYDPALSGQGFDLSVRGDRMTVYWYTYNVHNNSLRWYWGTTNLGDGSEEFTLYTTHDGTFADSTVAVVEEVGQGQLYFFGPERGVFNYRTTEHGRGSVEIQPVALSQDDRSGLWYEPKPNVKTGFSVQFFNHLDKAILYWYNYGAKQTTAQTKGYETQRWWLCDGNKVDTNKYAVTIYEAEGGYFGRPIKPNMRIVGNATLQVLPQDKMVFGYNIAADASTSGEGVLELSRLF